MRTISLCAVAVFAIGCRAGTAPTPRAALDAATARYAFVLRGQPLDSVLASWSADGELDLPGMAPLKGREAIRAFLTPMVGTVTVDSVTMGIDTATITGTTAQSSGRWRQIARPNGTPQAFHGSYDAQWVRASDGRWLLARLVMKPDA